MQNKELKNDLQSDASRIIKTDVGASDGQNKCPKCGAIIDLTTGICPDCKYEMPEFSDNTIVEKLSKRINRAKMMPLPNMFEVNAVEKFPIPSNRQDLLAVMAFINSKVKIMVAEGLYDKHRVITTYFRKLQECTG